MHAGIIYTVRMNRAGLLIQLLMLCVCAGVLPVSGCGRADDAPSLPNVVLISVDTLRADRMSLYGYERETTPFLEQFAREADMYTRCMATSPWTLPTHASMFTGLFPFEHGARRYLGEKPLVIYPPMPEELPLLPEILRKAGYVTLAYSANQAVIIPRHGFDRGFDLFRSQWMPSDILNQYAVRGVNLRAKDGKPFFLFINYLDTHVPYNSTPIPDFLAMEQGVDTVELQQAMFKLIVGKSKEIPEEKLQLLRDQYDNAVRHVDIAIGEIVQFLKERGVYDNTLVIITSDHGEFFGEHEMIGHVYELYQEVLHVPLIIKAPGQTEGRVIHDVASSVDIPGMIFDMVSPALAEEHRETFPYRVGGHPVIAECYYGSSEDIYDSPWAERFMKTQTAVFEWPWKLIADSNGVNQLFNLESDPRELSNLAVTETGRVEDMLQRLREWQDTRPRYTPNLEQNTEIDEEQREALEHLGYL